ncbi:MAG: glycosyltransferase family 4 protein [Bacteroidota bacterium]
MPDSKQHSPVVVAQLGARMHYAVPVMLHQAGLLDHFYTDLWFDLLPQWAQISIQAIPHQGIQRFTSRRHPDLPTDKVSALTYAGIRYAQQLRNCSSREEETRLYLEMGRKFTRWVGDQLLRQDQLPRMLYLFNSAALEIVEDAHFDASYTIVEQTLAPRLTERQILRKEYQKRDLTFPSDAYTDAYEQRELAEWQNSDVVLCGSDFVANAVQEITGGDVQTRVIPYGFTPENEWNSLPSERPSNSNLQILFVGNGGIRKGLPYLLEAVQDLTDVELHIVGHTGLPETIRQKYTHLDHIHWQNRVPRQQMKNIYEQADLFVLPSLCEGSATVIYEAMSYQLPIICTPNSGSVITDGQEGYLIPIQSSEALRDKIIQLRDDTTLRQTMSRNAAQTAEEYTVSRYRERLVQFVRDHL